jgi:integrase
MRWNDVHFERGTIFLPGTKTEAAPRTIPMSERLRVFPGALPAAKPAQQRTGLQRVNERAGGGELLNPMSAIEVVVKG